MLTPAKLFVIIVVLPCTLFLFRDFLHHRTGSGDGGNVSLVSNLVTRVTINSTHSSPAATNIYAAMHCIGHDEAFAISVGSDINVVVPLSFFLNGRTIPKSPAEFVWAWNKTLDKAYAMFEENTGIKRPVFDVLSRDKACEEMKNDIPAVRAIIPRHHDAHAIYSFYSSPFNTSLIITVDGGSAEGNFHVYLANRSDHSLVRIYHKSSKHHGSLGVAYRHLSTIPVSLSNTTETMSETERMSQWSFMTFSAAGVVNGSLYHNIYRAFTCGPHARQMTLCIQIVERYSHLKNYAATVQYVLEEIVFKRIQRFHMLFPLVDGISLSGGVIHNIRLNTALKTRLKVPIYIPPAPGDTGLVLGYIWKAIPPPAPKFMDFVYLGPQANDEEILPYFRSQYRTEPADPARVASLLHQNFTVGVLRGKMEIAPHAMGHRSIFASAFNASVKHRIEALAHQLSFQYTPIVMLTNGTQKLFHSEFRSPYMSYAPVVQNLTWRSYLTVCLNDGSVALQTVDETTLHDRWLFRLLVQLGNLMEVPILIQMPLKRFGKPIVNEITSALEMLQDRTLDFVVIEDTLFFPKEKQGT